MLRAAAIFLLLIPVAVVAQQDDDPTNPTVKTEYDRFANSTKVTLSASFAKTQTGQTVIGFVAVVPGKKLTATTPEVAMVVHHTSEDWMFTHGPHTLRAILNDEERLTLGSMIRIDYNALRSGNVSEALAVKIPFATATKLSEAKRVEMKVGGLEFELVNLTLDRLKEFISRFK